MALKKITDTLYQISRFAMVNCYLVLEDDGATLVDTGIAGMGKAIVKAADDAGTTIRRIALTHAHVDHVGALDELADLIPEVEFFFTPRTEQFLAGDLSLEPDEPQVPLKGGFSERRTRATHPIIPDETVGSLRVVPAKGHSPDQVAFLDERDGALICGDAFQTKGGTAVAGVLRWRFPFPAMATWNLQLAAKSATALLDLAPQLLAPGHGKVLHQPQEAMKKAIAEAEAKLKAVRSQE